MKIEAIAQTTVREDDLTAHIEDTERVFSLFRDNQPIKLAWNELSATEKQDQLRAAEREFYVTVFAPNGSY